ncbi:MAG: hypothetical protein MjAS7_2221 [Metallosphaera javensis (ex Sakai et al. 2022)]|nr:MAG: hypothetical protein MjAS7_2221 [Metallosphaera javensis (ex Sakai et al. 2022)]
MLILYSHNQMRPLTAIEIANGYIIIDMNIDLAPLDLRKYNSDASNIPNILPIATRLTDNSSECTSELEN